MAAEWYVGRSGEQSGPYTSQQLIQLANEGRLSPTDVLWKEGMSEWAPCSSVRGLFGEAASSSNPLPRRPAPRPTAPPPRVASSRVGNPRTDEFAVTDISESGLKTTLQPDVHQPSQDIRYAGFLERVVASLLDGLFSVLIACVPSIGIAFVLMSMAHGSPADEQAASVLAGLCFQLLYQVIALAYYVTAETSTKQGTWGKQILGIKVTDLQGNRITVSRAVARYFAKVITGLTFGIGLLMPLFTQKKQTLHDMIAGCLALKK